MSLADLVLLTLSSCGKSAIVVKTAAIKPIIVILKSISQSLPVHQHCRPHLFTFSFLYKIFLKITKKHSKVNQMLVCG